MEVLDFRFLKTVDNYDIKYSAWSRIYEYPFVLNTLKDLGCTNKSYIHNTCWGFNEIHINFKNDLDNLYENVIHSDIRKSELKNTIIYDVKDELPEYKEYFDFVLNISTIQELSVSTDIIINNLFKQVKKDGYLILTFDYDINNCNSNGNGSINLNELIKLLNYYSESEITIINPDEYAISGNNSKFPESYHSHLNCCILIIKKKISFKQKIAISLLTCSDFKYMEPCISSLLKSDLSMFDYKLFCIDNNSYDNTLEYLQNLKCNLYLKKNTYNDGIVKPRIEIMNEILKENYDYTLEIHSDMLFPEKWIIPLISLMNENVGVVMPFILNNPNKLLNNNELKKLVEINMENITYEMVRQVHPWLLNNETIKKIGYYDINYSPCECEDDDLMYRFIKYDYKIIASKKSMVLHYGGLTRNYLPDKDHTGTILSRNFRYFNDKYGISINEMIKLFTLHPVIINY